MGQSYLYYSVEFRNKRYWRKAYTDIEYDNEER